MAALKYEGGWKLKTFDFIVIFFTAGFEYFLFDFLERLSNSYKYVYLYFILFALFGIFGYIFTYKSTLALEDPKEKTTQTINIVVLLVISSISLIVFFSESEMSQIIANVIISILLLINVYTSLSLSGLTGKTA